MCTLRQLSLGCLEHVRSPALLFLACFVPPHTHRDGLITTTHTDNGCLVATCKDLTGTTTPLHAFAVNYSPAAAAAGTGAASSSCVAAAAWSDRLLVFSAPWQADDAPVLATYQCPQVGQACTHLVASSLQSWLAHSAFFCVAG